MRLPLFQPRAKASTLPKRLASRSSVLSVDTVDASIYAAVSPPSSFMLNTPATPKTSPDPPVLPVVRCTAPVVVLMVEFDSASSATGPVMSTSLPPSMKASVLSTMVLSATLAEMSMPKPLEPPGVKCWVGFWLTRVFWFPLDAFELPMLTDSKSTRLWVCASRSSSRMSTTAVFLISASSARKARVVLPISLTATDTATSSPPAFASATAKVSMVFSSSSSPFFAVMSMSGAVATVLAMPASVRLAISLMATETPMAWFFELPRAPTKLSMKEWSTADSEIDPASTSTPASLPSMMRARVMLAMSFQPTPPAKASSLPEAMAAAKDSMVASLTATSESAPSDSTEERSIRASTRLPMALMATAPP